MGSDRYEVHHNELGSIALRQMTSFERLTVLMVEGDMAGSKIKSVVVRGPVEKGGDFLVTVKATDPDGAPYVGWRSGASVAEAMTKVEQDWNNGTLHLKPDVPYEQRKAAQAGS